MLRPQVNTPTSHPTSLAEAVRNEQEDRMGAKYSEVERNLALYLKCVGVPVRGFGSRLCLPNWVSEIFTLLDQNAYLCEDQEVEVVRYCKDEEVRALVRLYLPAHGGESLLSYLASITRAAGQNH